MDSAAICALCAQGTEEREEVEESLSLLSVRLDKVECFCYIAPPVKGGVVLVLVLYRNDGSGRG